MNEIVKNALSGNFVVVLGMHRSGTSALAGVLNSLGFQAGKTLLPPGEFNERGYFEDRHLVRQHDALLKAIEHVWYDERSLPIGWLEGSAATEAKKTLTLHMRTDFDLNKNCVLKDPRMCWLLPLWKDIFSTLGIVPGYILSVRHPLEVAQSLMRRDGLAVKRSILLYASYLLEAERETRGLPRAVVEYTSLLDNWRSVLQTIESELCITLPPLDKELARRVEAFLSPDLKHFSASVQTRESSANPLNEWIRLAASQATLGKDQAGLSIPPDLLEGVGSHFVDEAVRIAQTVYRLVTGTLDARAFQALDTLRVELDRYLASLEPWLSIAAEADQLKQELLRPGPRFERVVESGAQSVLYWATRGGKYSEEQTVRQPWHYGVGRETLHFLLPPVAGCINRLRWDITDRPAFCEVFDVWVENPQGQRVWQWPLTEPLFDEPQTDMRVIQSTEKQDRLWVVSLGFDPRSPLNVPAEIVTQMTGGWMLGVVLSAVLTTKALPQLLDLLEHSSQTLEQSNQEKSAQEKLLAAERQVRIQQITQARDEQARLASEVKARLDNLQEEHDAVAKQLAAQKAQLQQASQTLEQANQAKAALENLAAERQEQIQQKVKLQDEQKKIIETKQAEISKLQAALREEKTRTGQLDDQIREMEIRLGLLKREMLRAEGQINLIKDLLLHDGDL